MPLLGPPAALVLLLSLAGPFALPAPPPAAQEQPSGSASPGPPTTPAPPAGASASPAPVPAATAATAAPAAPAAAAPASAQQPAAVPATASPPPAQFEDDSGDNPRPLFGDEAHRSALNTSAWVGVGVTTLLLGTAGFFAAAASEKAGNVNRLLTFRDPDTGMGQEYALWADQYEEDVRVGRRDERWAKGLLVAAGATAVASAVLFIIDGARAPAPESTPQARTRIPARRLPRLIGSASAQPRLGLSWSF